MKRKSITHEYISIKEEHNSLIFRMSNYIVLLSMRGFDVIFGVQFPEACYYILIFAIVGYDATKIINFMKGRK